MTNEERREAVKEGLPIKTTGHDALLLRKVKAVVGVMQNAGVTDELIDSDEGIGVLCVGVTDLWNLAPGEIKFSPAFSMLLEQLVVVSIEDE